MPRGLLVLGGKLTLFLRKEWEPPLRMIRLHRSGASNTRATISFDVPTVFPFQQGSGLIDLMHEPETRLAFTVTNPTEYERRNVVIRIGFHSATIASAQKYAGSSASASFEYSGARE